MNQSQQAVTKTTEILFTVPTHFTNHTCEISTVATQLQQADRSLTRREAITQARARVVDYCRKSAINEVSK